jgi:hypothetical protein
MATPPVFSTAQVLTAAAMNSVGMWLTQVQTIGSGVSSQAVTNAFTADYANYRIIVSECDLSNNGEALRLTLSGVTGNAYKTNMQFASWGTGAFTVTGSAAIATGFILGFGGNTDNSNMVCDIQNPQAAKPSGMTGSSSSETYFTISGGLCTSTVQSTGFTITVDGGTMTGGTIRVYGYHN